MMGAVQMAQGFGAHITAICATSSVNVPGVLDVLPEANSRALLDQLQAQVRRREEKAYENFNNFVKREGLQHLPHNCFGSNLIAKTMANLIVLKRPVCTR